MQGKIAAVCLLSTFLQVPTRATAQEYEVATHSLTLTSSSATGLQAIETRGRNGSPLFSSFFEALRFDGEEQVDFVVESTDPLRLSNDAVSVAIAAVSDGAIAVEWSALDGRDHLFEVELRSDDQTAYYGGGERFNALNQRGYILPMVSDDRYGNKGVGTHKPIPFVMSNRGFGIWVDSFYPGEFDLDGTGRFATVLRYRVPKLRVAFFGGPDMASILEEFTALAGRPRVPPPWAFGLWKSRDVHHNQDSVLVDVQRLRELGIPASVLVLDSPWETGYNDFIVNRQQFPDPESMFETIRQRGFELCLWLTPFINDLNVIDMQGIAQKSANFDEAAARGVLVEDSSGSPATMPWWKGTGGLVDFTNPEAVDWWYSELEKTLAYGTRAFKADDGEGNFVPGSVFHDGSSARAMKNRYGTLYNAALQEFIDTRLDGNGVLITRSGSNGTQRYPFAWAGDNRADFSYRDGLASVILAGQNAAMSGISLWGSDIAGYAGRPSTELFVRWSQFAVFTPLMQVHMTSNQGPWDFGPEALEIFRKFAVLRVQLFPYLYAAASESAETGMPVIRPMALAFPEDADAHRHPFQYMFGPELLVAPVYRPGFHRSVYLPEGTWYDFWTGRRIEGPIMEEVSAPLDRIPLFVREGAVIPMLPPDVETLVERSDAVDTDVVTLDDRRVLQVWPGTKALLETEGGLVAVLRGQGADRTLTVRPGPGERPAEIHLMYRTISGASAEGPAPIVDAMDDRTILRLADTGAEQTFTWQEQP